MIKKRFVIYKRDAFSLNHDNRRSDDVVCVRRHRHNKHHLQNRTKIEAAHKTTNVTRTIVVLVTDGSLGHQIKDKQNRLI